MSNNVIRESFIIYKDWDNAIRKAPVEMQAELYHALIDFVSTGEKPEGLSWQAEMLMSAIEKQIENTLERYKTSVENGKQGGRRREKEEPDSTPTEPSNNPTEPSNNLAEPSNNLAEPIQEKEEPNSNLNDYDYDYVYENVFSQSINNRAREVKEKSKIERLVWKNKFNDFWRYGITPEKDKLGFEVIDVLIEALNQAKSKEKLSYNSKKYNFNELYELFSKLDDDDLTKIVWSLQSQQEIQNRPYYILGALINKANEKQPKKLSKLDMFLLERTKGEKK